MYFPFATTKQHYCFNKHILSRDVRYVTVKGNVPLITEGDLTLITEGDLTLITKSDLTLIIEGYSTLAKISKFTNIV